MHTIWFIDRHAKLFAAKENNNKDAKFAVCEKISSVPKGHNACAVLPKRLCAKSNKDEKVQTC